MLDALPETQLTEAAKGGWMKSKDTAAPAGGSRPSVDTRSSHQPAGSWPPLGQTDIGSLGGHGAWAEAGGRGNWAELR